MDDYSRREINESNSNAAHALSSNIVHTKTEGNPSLIEMLSTKGHGVWFSIVVNQKGKLVACAFSDRSRGEAEKAVRNSLPTNSPHLLSKQNADSQSFRVLARFYNGKGVGTNLRALDLSSVSDFRREVYNLLCRIPIGKVTTYGAIAQKLGGKRYARAVGTAIATNPLPLIVPCHRVVPASLRVGNYGMCGRDPAQGGYMKRKLLEREGVKFQGERVSKQSTWVPK
jgi:methylated-DNA-[protein]-cysteine S-methyltransferase